MRAYVMVAAAVLAMPLAAKAQSGWNPSADELVGLLKPTAKGPTRGIRAMNAPALPVDPAPAVMQAHPRAVAPGHGSVQASAAPAAQAPASQAPASGELASVALSIAFENGSDRLTPAAIKTLNELGKALSSSELASYRFRIEGHTDAVGSRSLNEALSERRANAVSEYIAAHYGVNRARLTTVGLGQSQMLVPTADNVAEPRNRRVQIVNIGA